MKRVLVLAAAGLAAIAVALPATAAAAKFQGVVLTKKPARHALVTASRNGAVRTTRVRGSLARFRAGRIVAVQAAELPDGTYAASKIKLLGKTRLTRFRGSVVAASSKDLVVSAGMSVVSLVFRGSASALHPGDAVVLGASVSGAVLKTSPNRVRKVGHDGTLELEGIYLATGDDGTIELAVEHRGRVFVHVPSDLVVPSFQAGDEIALIVHVEADGSFTLIKADDESGDGDGDGGHTGGDRFSVAGVLVGLTHAEVAVAIDGQTSRMARCAVPDGFDLTGLATGNRVYMTCKYGGGHRVLVSLRKQTGSEYLVAIGHILDLGDGTITVQGDGDPIQCAVPDEFDLSEFDLGDPVVMSCLRVDGAWTLRALQKRDLPPPPPTVTITGHITALDVVDEFTVTVQGEHDPLTCDIPEGADLSAFQVNDAVSMTCLVSDDGLTLKHLQSATATWDDGSPPPPPPPPPPPSFVGASGTIAALASGSITVQTDGEPVTCAVPEGANLSAFHVTDYVSMKCVITSDGLRLERLQSATALYEAP
jgi:hypothetical protein